MPSPIALFAFNRPEHLRQTLSALAGNDLASQSDLTIFCDGARNFEDERAVRAVASIAESVEGFASVRIVRRPRNLGLAASIIRGVSEVLETNSTVIVLEDDLTTSPYFLRYMNDGLNCYADDPKVASIHGWCFPHVVADPPETFFLHGTDCFGWATWRRAWALFEPDAGKLLAGLRKRKLAYAFNCNGTYDYMNMLDMVRAGTVGSWAVRWRAAAFLHNMYTLHPGRSLVQHKGSDGLGTNVGVTDIFDVSLTQSPIHVAKIPVQEHDGMRKADMAFHSRLGCRPCLLNVLKRKARPMVGKSTLKKRCKSLMKDWLPLAVTRMVKQFAGEEAGIRWTGDYPDWQSAVAASAGYAQQSIFEKTRDAARAVRDRKALWERDSVLFHHVGFNWPLVAALMSVAAWNKGRLSVCDFGGAFGSTYMQHRLLLEKLSDVRWNIVEQARFVACGQQEFSTDVIQFYYSVEDCASAGPVDVVLFSGVLQYLEDPYELLERAAALLPLSIIVDRTPFAAKGERITVQHVPPEIYNASYPCRWLDKNRIENLLRRTMRLSPFWQSAVDPPGFQGVFACQPHIAE
ncbi:MAG: methyltransferase, TIGR04325 family [Desulfovibrio sp.]|jgi:putative methyltransferase (TIGR04325 family)|nr:methyltransferase, TIGR04325 family [Desulfovibrio sp.]